MADQDSDSFVFRDAPLTEAHLERAEYRRLTPSGRYGTPQGPRTRLIALIAGLVLIAVGALLVASGLWPVAVGIWSLGSAVAWIGRKTREAREDDMDRLRRQISE